MYNTFCAYYLAALSDFMAVSAGYWGDPTPLASWILMAIATVILLAGALPELITDAYWRGRAAAENLLG